LFPTGGTEIELKNSFQLAAGLLFGSYPSHGNSEDAKKDEADGKEMEGLPTH
jgi:hypothetical protein